MPTTEWVKSWKEKLPLQTIMRLLQVLVPQVEKICIDKYVVFVYVEVLQDGRIFLFCSKINQLIFQ